MHRQPLCCRDAGYVPLSLDFQVGESSGPHCSSPSLIIPIVIIPLNSRRLEGKTILIYQQPGSRRCKGCLGSRGRSEGRLLHPQGLSSTLSQGFRQEVQSECSSIPTLPVLLRWELPHAPQPRLCMGVIAWGSVPCRAQLDSGHQQWGSGEVLPKADAAFPQSGANIPLFVIHAIPV